MENNKLAVIKRALPMVKKESCNLPVAVVDFEYSKQNRYSFTYDFEDGTSFRMDETDTELSSTDFYDAEFDDSITETEKPYYIGAMSCGILTGILGELSFLLGDFKNKNDLKQLIIKAAKIAGCKKDDYKSAVNFIMGKAIHTINAGEKNPCRTVLMEHPTLVGLIFSLIAQYSEIGYILSEDGKLSEHKLPKYYRIGSNDSEKIVCAFFYWILALANDYASKHHIIDGLKMPKQLISIIKNIVSLKIFKTTDADYTGVEKKLSEFLGKLITNSGIFDNVEADNFAANVFEVLIKESGDVFAVIVNDSLTYAVYFAIKIYNAVKSGKADTFEKLADAITMEDIEADKKIRSHMLAIASAFFTGANLAGAIIKAVISKNKEKTFIADINIPGLVNCAVAVAQDVKYWDIKFDVIFENLKFKRRKESEKSEAASIENDEQAFKCLSLDAVQARILYSLEALDTEYDIKAEENKNSGQSEDKRLWLDKWKDSILTGIGYDRESSVPYFITDEKAIYDGLYEMASDKDNYHWMYLVTLELALFNPYTPLGTDDDVKFKKLKSNTDYVTAEYIRCQTVVSQDELGEIRKYYKTCMGHISGNTEKIIAGAAAAVGAAILTGGVAFAAAPNIAILVAGEAVAGLHGAALANAGLAFVGGGALAAGGLGMAGGTAIIAGGGALIGFAGAGSISTVAAIMNISSEYWVRQGSKLASYCRCVLINAFNDDDSVKAIADEIGRLADTAKKDIESLKADNCDLDSNLIKKITEYHKCLVRTENVIKKIKK